jgi:hypothetical protein
MIEKDVKRAVGKLLTEHGWFWWMPPAGAYGRSGASDFHAIRGGVFLAVETKVGKGKTTALQDRFLTNVSCNGGLSMVVNERNLVEFANAISNSLLPDEKLRETARRSCV